jgi:membrane-associated phospholipid phosphatase
LVWLISKYEIDRSASGLDEAGYRPILKSFRYWYGIAVILLSFKESYYIIQSLRPNDNDALLIRWDYVIFGVNPTVWAYRFANKYLTEFLQIIYFYYYIMIIVYGLENYLWKKYGEFKYTILVLFTAFFSSYLLYMVFPANGPRFHLHDFYSISRDLPGIFLTEPIRSFLNAGESIPAGITNPQDYVQRDAMPSLHISIAFLIAYLSWKFRSKSFYFYLPYSVLMVIATIYLRYHYVVDIFAGMIIALASIILSKIVDGKRTQAST